MTCHRINTTSVNSVAGIVYPFAAHDLTHFLYGSCCSIFSFLCCWSLFVVLPFFVWSLCCLSFGLCLLITLFVFPIFPYLLLTSDYYLVLKYNRTFINWWRESKYVLSISKRFIGHSDEIMTKNKPVKAKVILHTQCIIK
jgi:hypothetical protein